MSFVSAVPCKQCIEDTHQEVQLASELIVHDLTLLNCPNIQTQQGRHKVFGIGKMLVL